MEATTIKGQPTSFWVTYFIAITIFAACLMMNGPMRGGLPIDNDLASRMAYISENLSAWQLGWYLWMASAIGLFTFCALLASKVTPSTGRVIGLSLVAMGIAPDLIAEVIYAFIIPYAYESGVTLEVLGILEQVAMHLTGFLGNGLYNLGGITLTILLIKSVRIPTWASIWGMGSWVLGISLSVAIANKNTSLAEVFTASSMFLNTTWMLVMAHLLFRK